jgi:hypothetical protein
MFETARPLWSAQHVTPNGYYWATGRQAFLHFLLISCVCFLLSFCCFFFYFLQFLFVFPFFVSLLLCSHPSFCPSVHSFISYVCYFFLCISIFISSFLSVFNFHLTLICLVIPIICFSFLFPYLSVSSFLLSLLLIFPSPLFSLIFSIPPPIFAVYQTRPPVLASFPAHCTLKRWVRRDPIAGSGPQSTGEPRYCGHAKAMRTEDGLSSASLRTYVIWSKTAPFCFVLRCARARILWQYAGYSKCVFLWEIAKVQFEINAIL